LVQENTRRGLPVQRPLFLHNEGDPRCYTEQFEYLLGPDVLVAPVWQEAQDAREVYLPEGEWVHLWSGAAYPRGEHSVPAPLGEPPVFFRRGSVWEPLMKEIRSV
jgi:alpha-glucosidase